MDFEEDIKACMQVLQHDGVILYPTDTVWGLGCDALSANAVERIFDIKQRPKEKSMIVLLAEARDVLQYVAAPHPDIIAIIEGFTQPTTVIYENGLGFPPGVPAGDGSIAIRVTDDPFCKALIKRFRGPIVSTSANISGEPTPNIFPMVSPSIAERVGYVVRYRQDDDTINRPSRIVRINDDGEIELVRG